MTQNPGPYPGGQPGYPAGGVARTSGGGAVGGGALAVIGGIAAIVGAFLTWVTLAISASGGGVSQSVNITVTGMGKLGGVPESARVTSETAVDGYLVIAAGAIALIGGLIALGTRKGPASIVALIGGLGALGLGIYEMTQVSKFEDQYRALVNASAGEGVTANLDASVGIGLWIILVGGALAVIGAIIGMLGGRRTV
ncbi:MAG: hypothetical protein INR66_27080 [Gordonia polyisoprenivorans]|nr:hypothetical protein [Gordonia polyisoprenivorans]